MNKSADCKHSPRSRTKTRWKHRVRVLFRLAVRKLIRLELIEVDSHGTPKVNPIRWLI